MNLKTDLPKRLASPAQRALAAANITRVEQCAKYSREELLRLHGMGPKALAVIRNALLVRGLDFIPDGMSAKISAAANLRLPRCIPGKKVSD